MTSKQRVPRPSAAWVYRRLDDGSLPEMTAEEIAFVKRVARLVRRALLTVLQRLPHDVWTCVYNNDPRIIFDLPTEIEEPDRMIISGPIPIRDGLGLDAKEVPFHQVNTYLVTIGFDPLLRDHVASEEYLAQIAHEMGHALCRHNCREVVDADSENWIQMQKEADAAAAEWGFGHALLSWLKEKRYSYAWKMGKELRQGDPPPTMPPKDPDEVAELEAHIREGDERIAALKDKLKEIR